MENMENIFILKWLLEEVKWIVEPISNHLIEEQIIFQDISSQIKALGRSLDLFKAGYDKRQSDLIINKI